uniref:Uncharacterized protein n=1 Tax=Ascaris lumbricoides TaxID=6252 RepID=A0A0M3HT78_ASCLU
MEVTLFLKLNAQFISNKSGDEWCVASEEVRIKMPSEVLPFSWLSSEQTRWVEHNQGCLLSSLPRVVQTYGTGRDACDGDQGAAVMT